ncbi:hypothetical protein BH24BAC1_BH24BAC1_37900 [soil metagenome]
MILLPWLAQALPEKQEDYPPQKQGKSIPAEWQIRYIWGAKCAKKAGEHSHSFPNFTCS